jgi:putative type II/III system pilus formation protein
MTALIERCRFRRSLCFAVSLLAAVSFAQHRVMADGVTGGAGNGDDEISVRLDQTTLIKLPERAYTVIIGNPLIADVNIQPGGLMVVNGRGYGATNFIALDRSGATLMEKKVVVKSAADTVVVYRGTNRNTYSCAPNCEPRVTLGDSPSFFSDTLGQTGTWLGQVQGAAQIGADSSGARADRDRDRDRRTFDRRDSGSVPSWPFF